MLKYPLSSSSFERHLEAIECLDFRQKQEVLRELRDASEEEKNKKIRSLLLQEEIFLTSSDRFRPDQRVAYFKKTPERVADIREAGKYLTELLYVLREAATAGSEAIDLDFLTQAFARKYDLSLPVLGREGFRNCLTVSVNDRVVHAAPDATVFRTGDLVTLDTAIGYRGGIADSAVAFVVGGAVANPIANDLVSTLKSWIFEALPHLRPGATLSEFAFCLYDSYVCAGYRVIKNCSGHGVGIELHEKPAIYHWPNSCTDRTVLSVGDVITVEPIVTLRTNTVRYPDGDGVGYLSEGDIGAYWEYTLLIQEDGPEILAGIR